MSPFSPTRGHLSGASRPVSRDLLEVIIEDTQTKLNTYITEEPCDPEDLEVEGLTSLFQDSCSVKERGLFSPTPFLNGSQRFLYPSRSVSAVDEENVPKHICAKIQKNVLPEELKKRSYGAITDDDDAPQQPIKRQMVSNEMSIPKDTST